MVIIDTSVAYKWFDEKEVNSDTALEILHCHLSEKEQILIPDLLLYELTNAWIANRALSLDQIKENLSLFRRYGLGVVSISFDLIEKAAELSKEFQVTVYDAIYAILAQEKKCHLITADEKLADKIHLPYVLKLSVYKEFRLS